MPQALLALPAIIAGTAPLDLAAGSALGAGAFGGFGAGSFALFGSSALFSVGLSVGASYLAASLQRKPTADATASAVTINESIAPRTRGYGRCKIGGSRMLWANVSGYRISALAHCLGPISAIREIWFADDLATFASGEGPGSWGVVTSVASPMSGAARIQSFRGTGSQEASAWLTSLAPAWTASARARGIAYTVAAYASVDMEDFLATYKSNEPAVRVVADLSPVWDPRDAAQDPDDDWYDPVTWRWPTGPENPALAILDWLRHPDGRNKDRSRIDIDSFIAFADLCDETVARKDGTTDPRYRLSGTYQLNDEPSSVLPKFLATCDASLYLTTSGKIGIRGGKWTAPTLTFTADHILSLELARGNGFLATFSRTLTTYVSPDHDYQSMEADPWVDSAIETLWGSRTTSLPLDWVGSHSQARRLSKINAAKNNPDWVGKITLDVTGLDAIVDESFMIEIGEDDLWSGVVFMVQSWTIAADFTSIEFEVKSLAATAYDWDPETEEGTAPPIEIDVSSSDEIDVPNILSVRSESGELRIEVADPVTATWRLVARWAPTGTDEWTTIVQSTGISVARTGTLTDGSAYDVQCAFVAPSTARSDWTSVVTRAVSSTAAAPAAPTIDAVGGTTITATIGAPVDAGVDEARLWISTGSDFAVATLVGSVATTPGGTAVISVTPATIGAWTCWATVMTSSGWESAPSDPDVVTVTISGGGGGDAGGGEGGGG